MSQEDMFDGAPTGARQGGWSRTESGGADPRPLADRLRPRTLDEYVGQEHAVGAGTPLRRMIENDDLGNVILHGPPGIGKTSLARVISEATTAVFEPFNATAEGVKRIREIAEQAKVRLSAQKGRRTILFVDEIARFSKSQQDTLLPYAEDGTLILIAATTEQPSFYLNGALLSRSEVVTLKSLEAADIGRIVDHALTSERGFNGTRTLASDARDLLIKAAGGDGRRALTVLENAARLGDAPDITRGDVEKAIGSGGARYDRQQDHYDAASAFQKSLRGSDVDAALYWAARMLDSGEDPRFVFRRLIVTASEDVGAAHNDALLVAEAAYRAFEKIGPPEGFLNLAHAIVVVATSPKSNRSYLAWKAAMEAVRNTPDAEVPLHIRNAPTEHLAEQGYGEGYEYPFDRPEHFSGQSYLPDALRGVRFYDPSSMGGEKEITKRVEWWRARQGG